jgi:hypothetical protein
MGQNIFPYEVRPGKTIAPLTYQGFLIGSTPMDTEIDQLQEEIKRLQLEKADREAALPAHSIRPHQLLVIEDLEEEIAHRKKELEALLDNPGR